MINVTLEACVVMVMMPAVAAVTVHVAVNLPSSVAAVTVAVPGATAISLTSVFTATMRSLSVLHVTVLLVASAGLMVTSKVSVSPTNNKVSVWLRVIPVQESPPRVALCYRLPAGTRWPDTVNAHRTEHFLKIRLLLIMPLYFNRITA